VWVANALAYALGALWLTKLALRGTTGYRPRWHGQGTDPGADRGGARAACARWWPRGLAAIAMWLLFYCAASALNARATFDKDTLEFTYRDGVIPWLPHSYDAQRTWFEFWQWAGLACVFWATRDWLLTKSDRRSRHTDRSEPEVAPDAAEAGLPPRLTRLLWVMCLNATLVGVESILQRLDGTNKLLWLVEPYWNDTAASQFGPYAYRSNAAQFFNLVWPLGLALWWSLLPTARSRGAPHQRVGEGPQVLLFPCVVVLATCPFISSSRGGALIASACLALAGLVLLGATRRRGRLARLALASAALAALGLGATLGWRQLEHRFWPSASVLPLATDAGTNDIALAWRMHVPKERPKHILGLLTLNNDRNTMFVAQALTAYLRPEGDLAIYLTSADTSDYYRALVPRIIQQHGGNDVEIELRLHTNIAVRVAGQPVAVEEYWQGIQPPSRPELSTSYVWVYHTLVRALRVYVQTRETVSTDATAPVEPPLGTSASPIPSTADSPALSLQFDRSKQPLLKTILAELSGRDEIYRNARQMTTDYPWFGTGAGTFGAVYHLYRARAHEDWAGYAHNDWLELRITLGWVGFGLALALLVLAASHWFVGAGIGLPWPVIALLWIALAGMLAHARFDFPFQVHSLELYFLVICGICSIAAREA
jgi:O-antigen ligase